jgi:hypothetical protein
MDINQFVSTVENYIVNEKWSIYLEEKLFTKMSRKNLFEKLLESKGRGDEKLEFVKVMNSYGFDKEVSNQLYCYINDEIEADDLITCIEDKLKVSVRRNVKLIEYISYILLAYGKYLKAYHFLHLILKASGELYLPLVWKLWGSFIVGNEQQHETIYGSLLKQYKMPANKMKLKAFFAVMTGANDYLYEKKDLYENIIKGKRISIIGPANTSIEWDYIYNNSDIIVFISYKNNSVYHIDSLGKIIISYYNKESIMNITYNDIKYIEKLDMVCVKKKNKKNLNKKTRVFNCLDGMYFIGIPHMLPNILFDLFQYNPQIIRTYGFDMYMNKHQYRNNYIKNPNTSIQWMENFASHNIIIQYMILNKMYENNLFVPDVHLKNVLSMGIENYLKKMEDIYQI